MDPNAAYQAWKKAVESGDDDEAREIAIGLIEWFARGGFEPKWSDEEHAEFDGWVDEQDFEDDDLEEGRMTSKKLTESVFDDAVSQLVSNLKDTIQQVKRQGTVGMAKKNLRQLVSTRGVNLPNANAFERAFDAAYDQVKSQVKGFKLYETAPKPPSQHLVTTIRTENYVVADKVLLKILEQKVAARMAVERQRLAEGLLKESLEADERGSLGHFGPYEIFVLQTEWGWKVVVNGPDGEVYGKKTFMSQGAVEDYIQDITDAHRDDSSYRPMIVDLLEDNVSLTTEDPQDMKIKRGKDGEMRMTDPDAEEDSLHEVSPPGMKSFTHDSKVRSHFEKEYGDRGKSVEYATAWKHYNEEETEMPDNGDPGEVVDESEDHPGFKAVAQKIASKEGESIKDADAELAASSRNASAAAKAKNPRLNRVKG